MASDANYQVITDRILEKLAQGVNPWQQPWRAGARPYNAVTNKPYRGINRLILSLIPFEDPRYLTFKQAKDNGGTVKKGEHGLPIVFWTRLTSAKDDGTEIEFPFLSRSTAFNVTQCEGLKLKPLPIVESTIQPLFAAEHVVENMPNRPEIKHDASGVGAYYTPSTDIVALPNRNLFDSADSYYATLFHELAHSTGHAKRLNRKDFVARFGSEKYGREELIAEIAAAFVSAEVGIDSRLDSSAAYLDNWMSALGKDPQLVVVAAGAAQKAADYILGRKYGEDTAE